MPRIGSEHVINVEPVDPDEEDEGLSSSGGALRGHKSKPPTQAMRVMGSTNSHSSNYSDKLVITDESQQLEDDDYADEGVVVVGGRRSFGIVVEEEYDTPLVQQQQLKFNSNNTRLSTGQLIPRPTNAFQSFPGGSHALRIPAPPPLPGGTQNTKSQPSSSSSPVIITVDSLPNQGKYSSSPLTNENGLRVSAGSSRKLPTIMEGLDGQIPPPVWPDMDDSLMDINFESFLYSNEKRESGGQQHKPPPRPRTRCDSPIYERGNNGDSSSGGARANDIENNYRCMKYLNSCSENPYLVEGVEDLQMSVDKSLALYLKKCDDSLTMQNTRDFLEDIRSKLNGLLEHHARHTRVTKVESLVYQKSVALIERQIEKLKYDLDSYLRLFNQSNELQIKQLCTGLAKDARIQSVQNAVENRHNSLRSGRESMVSSTIHDPNPTTKTPMMKLGPAAANRLPFSTKATAANDISTVDEYVDELDDNELNNYETMRDQRQWQQQQPQNVFHVVSQYPENDLSSYFDTVYVQDGFNMGYKVNNNHSTLADNFDGSVVLRHGKSIRAPFEHSVIRSNSKSSALKSKHQRPLGPAVVSGTTLAKQKRSNDTSNYNSIASSADPNFRLKRNPSLSLSTASHTYSDRHPILASRDYERVSKHEEPVTTDDSLNGSHDYPETDSLDSHKIGREGQRVQNMIMAGRQDSGHARFNAEAVTGQAQEARKSIASVDRQDLIQEWHKNRPSIWELYYGINRPKQSMMSKKSSSAQPKVVKSGKKKAAIPYVSIIHTLSP